MPKREVTDRDVLKATLRDLGYLGEKDAAMYDDEYDRWYYPIDRLNPDKHINKVNRAIRRIEKRLGVKP